MNAVNYPVGAALVLHYDYSKLTADEIELARDLKLLDLREKIINIQETALEELRVFSPISHDYWWRKFASQKIVKVDLGREMTFLTIKEEAQDYLSTRLAQERNTSPDLTQMKRSKADLFKALRSRKEKLEELEDLFQDYFSLFSLVSSLKEQLQRFKEFLNSVQEELRLNTHKIFSEQEDNSDYNYPLSAELIHKTKILAVAILLGKSLPQTMSDLKQICLQEKWQAFLSNELEKGKMFNTATELCKVKWEFFRQHWDSLGVDPENRNSSVLQEDVFLQQLQICLNDILEDEETIDYQEEVFDKRRKSQRELNTEYLKQKLLTLLAEEKKRISQGIDQLEKMAVLPLNMLSKIMMYLKENIYYRMAEEALIASRSEDLHPIAKAICKTIIISTLGSILTFSLYLELGFISSLSIAYFLLSYLNSFLIDVDLLYRLAEFVGISPNIVIKKFDRIFEMITCAQYVLIQTLHYGSFSLAATAFHVSAYVTAYLFRSTIQASLGYLSKKLFNPYLAKQAIFLANSPLAFCLGLWVGRTTVIKIVDMTYNYFVPPQFLSNQATCQKYPEECRQKAYAVLGLPPLGRDQESLHKAYQQQVLRYHPDKNPHDPMAQAKFIEVQEAYERLKELGATLAI